MKKTDEKTKEAVVNNARVQVITATQTAMPELERPEKTMYYVMVETEKGRYVMNIGEKSYKEIKELTK
jgi:hypothetical protein